MALDIRTWSSRQKLQRRGDYGDEQERYTYYLGWDGGLFVENYSHYDGNLDGRYFSGSSETTERPMGESDILSFDFERKLWHRKGTLGVSSNIMEGRLRVRAKGVGLSRLLKQLLEEKT